MRPLAGQGGSAKGFCASTRNRSSCLLSGERSPGSVITKVEPMNADDEPAPGRLQPSPDFSSLQGLQVVGDGPWSSDDHGDETVHQALALELEARAARF